MKNKLTFLVVAVAMVLSFGLMASPSFAAVAAQTESWTDSDVTEFNAYNPSAAKTYAGQRLKGLFQAGTTTFAECTTSVGSCNTVATTETTKVTYKTTGGDFGESIALADGFVNQRKTYVLATDGGKDFYVSPLTAAGFTNIQLSDAGDSVTLEFDGTSWFVAGNAGATINQ